MSEGTGPDGGSPPGPSGADGVPARARGVASRLIEGEAVLVVAPRAGRPRGGSVHVLNEAGSAVWALMDGERAEPEIASDIARRYGVGPEAASRDLRAFLDELERAGAADTLGGPRRSLAPRSSPPEPTSYAPPAIAESQPIEILAAICSSVLQSVEPPGGGPPKAPPGSKCRADETLCKKLFE